MREALEADDERDDREQVDQLDRLAATHWPSLRLNICSMRSVTTKPPTTLIAPKTTAIRPEDRREPAAAGTRDEDRADDHDAVDRVGARHQRRVQHRRHLRDHLEADEHGEGEHGQLVDQLRIHVRRSRTAGWTTAPAWQTRQPAMTSSSAFDREPAVLGEGDGEQLGDVAGVEAARVVRHGGRRIAVADDRDVLVHDGLAGHGQLAVAARLGGQVDDHRAGPHRGDHVGGDELRRGAARHERGRDDDVAAGDVLGEQLALQPLGLVGLLLRVAAAALAGLGQLDLEEAWRRGSRPARARRGACRTR